VTAPRAAPGWVLHPSREEDQTAFHARSPSGMDYVRLSELEAGLLAHMDGKRDEAQLAQQMQQHGYFCSTNYVREFIRRAGPLGLIQGAPLAPKPRSPLLARLFYIRVPLFDPSPHLGTAAAIWRKLVRPSMLLPAIALLCVALYLVLHNAAEFARSADQALHPRGLPWILGIALLSKSLHELAHAAAARRHGCEVREAGIVFLCMLPCLYVNTTDAWGLRDAHKRFEIAAAGLGMELLLGAVAALIWFASEGGVIHQIAFYLMAISWLSSLLFNANPLMRFDGYFMLADRLALPNLMQRSSRYLQHLIFGRFFGFGTPRNPSRTHREERILVIYGIASGLYRILLGLLIAKVMHARFDKGVGTLLFVATIWLFVLAPLLRSIQLLWQQRSEIQLRPLRTGIAAFFALLILAIAVLPLASHDVVPCVTFCPNAIPAHLTTERRARQRGTHPTQRPRGGGLAPPAPRRRPGACSQGRADRRTHHRAATSRDHRPQPGLARACQARPRTGRSPSPNPTRRTGSCSGHGPSSGAGPHSRVEPGPRTRTSRACRRSAWPAPHRSGPCRPSGPDRSRALRYPGG
jgi:hypothetical protein